MDTQLIFTRESAMHVPDAAGSRDILLKRVKRLLEFEGYVNRSSELRGQILPFLYSLGSVALIGGAIRDVARAGKRTFSSDYDFVVYGGDHDTFVRSMVQEGGVRNRFGGYALHHYHTKVDVWHIQDTWAHTAGLAKVSMPADLIQCTFFDWDSVVYDLGSRRLIVPQDYFSRLRLKVMDIRLEANPNPMGSLVRALRRAALWGVRFGPKLTAFCRQRLCEYEWSSLVELDARAFSIPVLFRLSREVLLERLNIPLTTDVGEVTWLVPALHRPRLQQLEFSFADQTGSGRKLLSDAP